ncbi:hypothetical protein H6P81_003830 [Aristolochia fimbriata]|uniref:Uncharacterized protein n=1 Tax=Aristolochia fimbriata TaxID=158543 RepID=A0AAV7FDP6_ARIFI|nr:hypothetical protein H6P81_003830 [Aristolochia fimbriata]
MASERQVFFCLFCGCGQQHRQRRLFCRWATGFFRSGIELLLPRFVPNRTAPPPPVCPSLAALPSALPRLRLPPPLSLSLSTSIPYREPAFSADSATGPTQCDTYRVPPPLVAVIMPNLIPGTTVRL